MKLEDITQAVLITTANEQERADCCTILEYGGYKEWGVSMHGLHSTMPHIYVNPPSLEFTTTYEKSRVDAAQFITDNTIKP